MNGAIALVLTPLAMLACVPLAGRRTSLLPWALLLSCAGQLLAFTWCYAWPLAVGSAVEGAAFDAHWFSFPAGGRGALLARITLEINGLNALMVSLNAVLFASAALATPRDVQRPALYYSLLLVLQATLTVCFLAQDLFLFFLAFELMLAPMFFLINIWGGERRAYAAMKFLIYTLAGSVFMLAALVIVPYGVLDAAGAHSFSLGVLADPAARVAGSLLADPAIRTLLFWAFTIAFLVKLPTAPLHTWLPDAHVQASTPVSMLLAGVLLKVGGYGFIRVSVALFPDVVATQGAWLGGLAAFSAVWGGLNALAQNNLKRMVAYSSVGHMGYVLLGAAAMNATALNGALLHMFNHGIISAALFFLAGVLQKRTGNLEIDAYRGLWGVMPVYAGFTALFFFAGMGLPGLSAFVSEALTFGGAWRAASDGLLSSTSVAIAMRGILLSGGYFIWAYRRMFWGETAVMGGDAWLVALKDLTLRERIILGGLAVLVIVPGVAPSALTFLMDADVAAFVRGLRPQ